MARATLPVNVERRLHAQSEIRATLDRLERQRETETQAPFVTLSRQYGCNAYELAESLAERLTITVPATEYTVYDRKTVEMLAEEESVGSFVDTLNERSRGMIEDWVAHMMVDRPPDIRVFKHLAETVCSIASLGQSIIVGRGGAAITSRIPNGIHVRLVAPLEWRIENLKGRYPDQESTAKEVERADKEREGFVQRYMGVDVTDPQLSTPC